MLVFIGCFGAVPAVAETVISGDLDANAPLVIDPTGDPVDASTRTLDITGSGFIGAYISHMPVTKRITQVTLGDLASAASCGNPASAQLFVREHLTGDANNSNQIAYSPGAEQFPASPGRITWAIPPTTLRRGRGYTFHLGWAGGSSCYNIQLTTWAHNEPTVDGGDAPCTAGPPSSASGSAAGQRTWHSLGANDRQPACISSTESFDSSMPTGWIQTSGHWVYSATNWENQPSAIDACGSIAAAGGAQVVLWRPSPTMPLTHKDYVCRWPQYGPLEERSEHGWYNGRPWKNDGGAPRDIYLKLDTIDYDPLLEQYHPILKYDSGEDFHVLSPAAMTDFYDGSLFDSSNSLKDGDGEFAVANPAFGSSSSYALDQLNLDHIRQTYPMGEPPASPRSFTPAEEDDFLSARGDNEDGLYDDDSREMETRSGYPDKIYGRIAHGNDGKLWLQYWFFYYFNPDFIGLGESVHEGDWEMIQVGLDSALTPDIAVYAQHTYAEKCDWAFVQRDDDHPVIYVAESSHASYFNSEDTEGTFDHADGDGGSLDSPDIQQIRSDDPAWVAWPGSWGDSGGSPPGPRFQGNKWDDPSDWATDASEASAC
jgi:hypothetical protein